MPYSRHRMKGLSLLIVLLDRLCVRVCAMMRRMKKQDMLSFSPSLDRSLTFLSFHPKTLCHFNFNTNSMKMRQNSNEVQEKEEAKNKETRIWIQVGNKSKFAVCLKIGLFLHWERHNTKKTKKEFVLNAISCHIQAKIVCILSKPKTQLPRTSGWIRKKCCRFSNEMKQNEVKRRKEKRERKMKNKIGNN